MGSVLELPGIDTKLREVLREAIASFMVKDQPLFYLQRVDTIFQNVIFFLPPGSAAQPQFPNGRPRKSSASSAERPPQVLLHLHQSQTTTKIINIIMIMFTRMRTMVFILHVLTLLSINRVDVLSAWGLPRSDFASLLPPQPYCLLRSIFF